MQNSEDRIQKTENGIDRKTALKMSEKKALKFMNFLHYRTEYGKNSGEIKLIYVQLLTQNQAHALKIALFVPNPPIVKQILTFIL